MSDKRINLLVVDDDSTNIRVLYEVLKEEYGVYFATSGRQALEVVHDRRPDLILLDVMMPEMDGYEVCRRLKADAESAEIPVIFVTAKGQVDDETEGFAAGAVDYISKPIEPSLVRARVRAQLDEKLKLLSERARAAETTRRLMEENRRLARRVITVQEEERRALARELHDEVGQWLTALQADAGAIRRHCEGLDPELVESAWGVTESASQLSDIIARIQERLRPRLLDDLGLVESVAVYLGDWERHHGGVRCRLEVEGRVPPLTDETAITAFRLVQEALTNVARHADAEQVEVALACRAAEPGGTEELWVSVADDGRGMEPGRPTGGVGLLGMRERALALGGGFAIDAAPGCGVRLEARLPLAVVREEKGDE